jgi:hypothetical protein
MEITKKSIISIILKIISFIKIKILTKYTNIKSNAR